MQVADRPDWERLLAAERHLQPINGVLTGIRQLRRVKPLECEEVSGLRVPTLAEMVRIKAWLLTTRLTAEDYFDTVVLLERLGEDGSRRALANLDEIYPQPEEGVVSGELAERLGAAEPVDPAQIDLEANRELLTPWSDWNYVRARDASGPRWWRISC